MISAKGQSEKRQQGPQAPPCPPPPTHPPTLPTAFQSREREEQSGKERARGSLTEMTF